MCVSVYVHVCAHVHAYIHVCICVHGHMFACEHVHMLCETKCIFHYLVYMNNKESV